MTRVFTLPNKGTLLWIPSRASTRLFTRLSLSLARLSSRVQLHATR